MSNLPASLAEISLQTTSLEWSQDIYAERFRASYKLLSGGGRSVVGASEVSRNDFFGRRWLHWEAAAGVVCLREIWLDQDLVDNALCLQLGELYLGTPLSVHFECLPSEDAAITIRVCFVMCDGSVHNIRLQSHERNRSVLADLVDFKAGGLLSTRSEPFLQSSSVGLIKSHQISDSIRETQRICCASHLSHFGIIFGLSLGDVVYVRMSPSGLFVETVLRDQSPLTALWSGLMGTNKRPAVVAVSGSHLRDMSILVSVCANGILRVWDCLARSCLQQLPLLDLVDENSRPSAHQQVVMEGVCVDTHPMGNAGLMITAGITLRVGRVRTWNVVVLSWSPSRSSEVPLRAYLTPPSFDSTLSSVDISLEQITLNPCSSCSHGEAASVVSLWNVNGDIVPVSYSLEGISWSAEGHAAACHSSDVPYFVPRLVSFGPAETHRYMSTMDEMLLRDAQNRVGWTPDGRMFNGEFKARSSGIKRTFLQRMFAPNRFSFDIIIGVLSHDVPYEVQKNQQTLHDLTERYESSATNILIENVLDVFAGMEEDAYDELRVNEMSSESSIADSTALRLQALTNVALRLLSLCEIRNRELRSSSSSCSILVRNRGSFSDHVLVPAGSDIPFEFVVIRPSGIGIVVETPFIVDAGEDVIPNYMNTQHTFVHFKRKLGERELQNTDKLLAWRVLEAVSESVASSRALELDAALQRFTADVVTVTDKNSEWIKEAIVNYVQSTDNDVFEIVKTLFSQCGGLTETTAQALVDDMLSEVLMPSWSQYGGTQGYNSLRNPLQGRMGSHLVREACALSVRDHYEYTRAVVFALVSLCHLDDSAFPRRVVTIIRDLHLPQAISHMQFYAFIMWTQSVHVSSNHQLDRTVDFDDVQYDSSLIADLSSTTMEIRAHSRSEESTSVWVTFWERVGPRMSIPLSSGGMWVALLERCHFALRPSSLSDYTSFLYSQGQYACITRAISLSMRIRNNVSYGIPMEDDSNSNLKIMQEYFLKCRNETALAISCLQAHLRDISSMISEADFETKIDQSLQQDLLQVVDDLVAIPLWDDKIDTLGATQDDGIHMDVDTADSIPQLNHSDVAALIKEWTASHVQSSGDFAVNSNSEGILCLGEALLRLSSVSGFRMYLSSLITSYPNENCIDVLILRNPSALRRFHVLYHHINTQSLLERCRSVLPSLVGDILALKGCYAGIESVRHAKEFNFDRVVQNELDILAIALWSSVFKFSLHSVLLDESLDAIVELIRLSGPLTHTSSEGSQYHDRISHWRGCLRSLISKACATGHLGWLCSLTFRCEDSNNAFVDLTKEISTEMEFLVTSSDFIDVSDLPDESNADASWNTLYDCLATFLLSNQDYGECARVLYQYYRRLDAEGSPTLRRLRMQQRCLSIAISALNNLPEDQRFVIYKCPVQMPASTGGSLGKRNIRGVKSSFPPSPPSGKVLSYTTLEELEHMYLQAHCKVFLLSYEKEGVHNPYIVYSTDDSNLVRMLADAGNFVDAVNLSRHNFPTNTTSARNTSLEYVISTLASRCVSEDGGRDLEEQFIAMHGCPPISREVNDEESNKSHMWNYLIRCLHIADGPECNWELHNAAAKACLRISRDFFNEDEYNHFTKARKSRIRSLISATDVSSTQYEGNLPALLRTLIGEGELEEACDLAADYINKCCGEHSQMECIPYDSLDKLLHACREVLKVDDRHTIVEDNLVEVAHDPNDPTELMLLENLAQRYSKLEIAIEKYFERLYLAEMGNE